MSDRKTDTIEIGKGVQYAKVASRCAEFHRDNEQCSVETSCDFREGWVIFTATVTTKKGTFAGHSMDKVQGRQKQFEKQETIAVGRALAFAGYLASGDIATHEEMASVLTTDQLNTLKLKYSKVHSETLEGLDRPAKQAAFNSWCMSVIGEQTDYTDASAWEPAWFRQCWRELVGPDSDIPFDQ